MAAHAAPAAGFITSRIGCCSRMLVLSATAPESILNFNTVLRLQIKTLEASTAPF